MQVIFGLVMQCPHSWRCRIWNRSSLSSTGRVRVASVFMALVPEVLVLQDMNGNIPRLHRANTVDPRLVVLVPTMFFKLQDSDRTFPWS
jgi:hypothetical protein